VETPTLNVDYYRDFAADQIYATDTMATHSLCTIKMPKVKGKGKSTAERKG
jgi:hypothetical protein